MILGQPWAPPTTTAGAAATEPQQPAPHWQVKDSLVWTRQSAVIAIKNTTRSGSAVNAESVLIVARREIADRCYLNQQTTQHSEPGTKLHTVPLLLQWQVHTRVGL